MKKVLILGGGFAGVDAATHLCKEDYEVTLVSQRDFFYINPTSIWIPTHDASLKDVSVPLKDLSKAHGFKYIVDGVKSIKAKEKIVTLDSEEVIDDFDYLIVAMGANKMKHKGIENTMSICGEPQVAEDIRDKLDELIQKGSGKIAFGFGGNPKDSSAVRGGPGFELLFNVHNMLNKKGLRDKFELTMFAPMQKPGARMGEQALGTMAKMFDKYKINSRYGKKIKAFENDGVVFEDDSKLISDFVMFIPAGDGHKVVKESDLPQNEAGFVKTNDYSEVDGFDYIYAIGDIAALEGPDWRAKQGHVAEVMAKNAAFNIVAKDKGLKERKGYQEHLNIICVMDSGDGAGFVFRDDKKAFMMPMPVFGHWLKKGWGKYCALSKLGKIPRIPGL